VCSSFVASVALVMMIDVEDPNSRRRRNAATSMGAAFKVRFFRLRPDLSTQ